jgi:hypothetical protein
LSQLGWYLFRHSKNLRGKSSAFPPLVILLPFASIKI